MTSHRESEEEEPVTPADQGTDHEDPGLVEMVLQLKSQNIIKW